MEQEVVEMELLELLIPEVEVEVQDLPQSRMEVLGEVLGVLVLL